MFRSKAKRHPSALAQEKFDTILGPQTEIQGDIRVSESVRIDGRLTGNVCAETNGHVTVVVGAHGVVVGNVSARRVAVAGKVQGSIEALEEVELHSGSVVEGDVACASLSIAHGARVMGRVTASHECPLINTQENPAVCAPTGKKKVELVA